MKRRTTSRLNGAVSTILRAPPLRDATSNA
jgi:hypothetical protein